jgi:hypothetical protein
MRSPGSNAWSYALVGLLVVSACSPSHAVHVGMGSSPSNSNGTTTTVGRACPTVVTTTSVPDPPDSHLQQPWTVPSYKPSQALGDFRMEPAPTSVHPRRTSAQALALAKVSPAFGGLNGGTDISIRFGYFVGNLVNIGNDANHTLQGSTAVSGVPAWVVVAYGVTPLTVGGPAPLGDNATISTLPPCPSQAADAVVVIGDADGKELANLGSGGFATLN